MGDLFFAVAGLAGGNQLAEETTQWRARCARALRDAIAQQRWADDAATAASGEAAVVEGVGVTVKAGWAQ